MSDLTAPGNAIGRVGMVAALRHVAEPEIGKLVVLEKPAGYVSTAVGSNKPLFAWHTEALGSPFTVRGNPTHSLLVPDILLIPMGQMLPKQARAVVLAHARAEREAALDDLARIVRSSHLSPEELDRAVDRCGDYLQIQRALEGVSLPQVLTEIGFWTENAGDTFNWVSVHQGVEMTFMAGPVGEDQWRLLGTAKLPTKLVCSERVVPFMALRGQQMLKVLNLWREAFGRETLSERLELGLVYERHAAMMSQLALKPPCLYPDPLVLRQTLKWLCTRHCDHLDGDPELVLSWSDGLLRIRVHGAVYGIPAQGSWLDDVRIRLSDLLAIPLSAFRGRYVRIELAHDRLVIAGYPIKLISES